MLKLLEQKVVITMSQGESKQLKAMLLNWFELQKYAPADDYRRALQQAVGDEVREYFEVAADGSFSFDVLVLWAER